MSEGFSINEPITAWVHETHNGMVAWTGVDQWAEKSPTPWNRWGVDLIPQSDGSYLLEVCLDKLKEAIRGLARPEQEDYVAGMVILVSLMREPTLAELHWAEDHMLEEAPALLALLSRVQMRALPGSS